MDLLQPFFVIVFSMLVAWWLTGLARRYALRRDMLDIPNQRSSHSAPTPRGGGIAIILVAAGMHLFAAWLYPAQAELLAVLGLTLSCYALLGWLDDHADLSSLVRLIVQLLIALIIVAWLGYHDVFDTVNVPLAALVAIAVIWVVWMANLYNFMDGIDGIAAIETLVLAATTGAWFAAAGGVGISLGAFAIAGAAIGFLGWNWSPAKIFMGDVGSVALGAWFAVLALIGSSIYGLSMTAFVILYAVFLVDASITLIRRMLRREKWWQAHRSHYYQRAVQLGWSHARVSSIVLLFNLLLAGLASALVAGFLPTGLGLLLTALILGIPIILLDLRSRQTIN